MADSSSSSEHRNLLTEQLKALLNSIQKFAAEPADFLIYFARNAELSEEKTVLGERLEEVLNAFKASEELRGNTLGWARKEMMQEYAQQLLQLMYSALGIWFSARNATVEHFESINIDNIATQMREHAPDLWDLLGVLLDANVDLSYGRKKEAERQAKKRGSQVDEDDKADEDYWNNEGAAIDQVNDEEIEDFESPDSQEPPVSSIQIVPPLMLLSLTLNLHKSIPKHLIIHLVFYDANGSFNGSFSAILSIVVLNTFQNSKVTSEKQNQRLLTKFL